MASFPLATSAALQTHVCKHLAIGVEGQIVIVFPRGTPYIKVKKLADRIPNSEIRLQHVRVVYEILPDNEVYDTSPKVTY
jgi:hypothetical protein